MAPNIAVIYYSRGGTVHALAEAAADGARAGGASVRLLRVEDGAGRREPKPCLLRVPVADHEDLLWADGLVLGTPTYFGNVSAPLKQFIESTSQLWKAGALADRVVAGMTSSNSLHGGRETTLLALYQSMYHWGALIAPPGQADPSFTASGGNPYGVAAPSDPDGVVAEAYLRAARALGLRVSDMAGRLAGPAAGRARIAVIYCPADEATCALAAAMAQGALAQGAEVRLRRVGRPRARLPRVPSATAADLEWADAIAFGAPARNGFVAPRLWEFIESCVPLRAVGKLDGKASTGFVTTRYPHDGSETALLALYNALHHWGTVIVPPGYTDPTIAAAGGNPYGISHTASAGPLPDRETVSAAEFQGGRLARLAALLRGAPRAVPPAQRAPDLSPATC